MIGEKIKKARKLKGISQEELAAAVGMHTNTVARWERGELNPMGKSLQKVAQALNIPISALYDEQQPMHKQDLSMAYWGDVADNIRELLESNDNKEKISIIKSMLLNSLKSGDSTVKTNGISIKQENIGHDAIAKVGNKNYD